MISFVAIAFVLGYLIGAVPFGYLVARAHGVDILREGSGNIGATNIKRVIGARAGNSVFALDFAKGLAAAGWPYLLRWFDVPSEWILWAVVAGLVGAIVGHSFSIFLRGKGGKGVATTMGGLLVVMPFAVLIGIACWLVVFYAFRYVSLASIVFAVSLPLSNYFLGQERLLVYLGGGLALLIIVRHRSNIARLWQGTENRFEKKRNGAGAVESGRAGEEAERPDENMKR